MLHDQVFSQATGESAVALPDRRKGCRVPFPAELLLIWHHDLRNAIRYRIIDASDGGFRIESAVPLLDGMTGMALKMLPGGEPIDQTVCVAWARPIADVPGRHEVGLRYL